MEYNDIIKELEQVVKELEQGDCGLEKSASLYERGVELASMLGEKLDETKGRITILKKQMDKIVEEDFN